MVVRCGDFSPGLGMGGVSDGAYLLVDGVNGCTLSDM